MKRFTSRRTFLRQLGVGAAVAPFLGNLSSIGLASSPEKRQRLIIMFSPNGVVQKNFWPDAAGPLTEFKPILAPLEPFRERTLMLHGISDKIRGDGDQHMRGMGCLLTGIELFPGSVQGGGDTPAGWASGLSIDQELKACLQSRPETRTRFGSLEFGVGVPNRADTWTRMVYAGPNQPIAPIDDPYQMFHKFYGQARDRESLGSILDDLTDDLRRVGRRLGTADRQLLEQHASFVREMESELAREPLPGAQHALPPLEPGVADENDNIPRISRMQIDLLVHSLQVDFTRVATLQYTNSVGDARMRWLDIDDGHHHLSHEPDTNEEAQEKLTRINRWYCEQLVYLVQKLAETPEPGGTGTLLDNTTIVWTNELGKGNTHTLDDVPFVLVGEGLGFQMGRMLEFKKTPHNRLLLSLAQAMGHPLETFGNPEYCREGALILT